MLSGVCFTACVIGAILDIMAAFLLQRTDFTQCAYTSSAIMVSCASPVCPNLQVQANTCYCCYLYDTRTKGGCDTSLLLAKQTYFSGVDSCSAITSTLQPMLSTMAGLNLLAAVMSMVYIFQSNPIVYQEQRDSKPPSTHNNNNSLKILRTVKAMAGYLLGKQFKNVTETETTDTVIDNNNSWTYKVTNFLEIYYCHLFSLQWSVHWAPIALQRYWGPGPLGKVLLANTRTCTALQCLPYWDELRSRLL